MTKFLFAALASALAFASFTGPTEAGCVKGAIVGGIVGHMMGHGGVGAATGCAYGAHQSHKAKQQRQEDYQQAAPATNNSGRTTY
jgi:uncharacterized protein YcfJ